MATNDLLIRLLARNETKGAVNEVKNSLSSLTGIAAGFGVALSAGMFAKFSAEAVVMAANAEQIEGAFNNMASGMGRSADSILADMQRISRGAISETSLMQAANTAMLLGGKTFASELPTLLEVARAGSVALGQDMQFMFQSIITGIARQSPLILDNLGIVVDLETANRNYAAALGVTVEAMTEEQKVQALLNDILRVAPDYIAKVGTDATTTAEQIKTLAAASTELKTAWGELLLEIGVGQALSNAAQAMRDLVDEAGRAQFGALLTDLNEMVSTLAAAGDSRAAGELARRIDEIRLSGMSLEDAIPTMQGLLDVTRNLGSGAEKSIPPLKDLAAIHEVITKKTKPLADGINKEVTAITSAILPTMQWADALAALNVEKSKSLVLGFGPMSQAGPPGKLLEGLFLNQTRLGDTMNLTVDEWVAKVLAGNEIVAADSKTTAQTVANDWQSAFNSVRSSAESALTARMQPTELDFLQTGLGTYQDAPLENVRRLDAIIQRGMDEISAHPDWAAILEIPADVLAGGGDALKAWAMQTRESVANLARPDLIDWDAFVAEFQRQQQEASAKALTLDIAMGKLAQAGLLGEGNQAAQKAQIAAMLGLDTPELAAASIAEGFQTAFAANNPATALLGSIQTKVGTQEVAYGETGKKAGNWIGASIKSAALLELDGFLPDLAARLSPYLTLPGGNPPP